MENSEKPINPLYGANKALYTSKGIDAEYLKNGKPLIGLTKREHFAIQIASSLTYEFTHGKYTKEDLATNAIELADELLKQLDAVREKF
jgi:hypothetical protein